MKNLKKLVSVIVTVAMLISSFAVLSVSAAYADVDESNSYAKAIEVLSGLGIVKGDDEGNFNPTNDIKRSEMVALICRMKGEEGIATSTVQEFDDVPANHWAAGYISWGVASEIIKGYGDGNFGPDASVTLQDAVVMIVRAAGWERIANRSDFGGYPTGHMRIANGRGVMDGINYTATKAATREVIAQAIYNGMTMPLVEYISFGENADDDRYAIYDGRATGYELATLLTNTNRIYKVKAEVTDVARVNDSLKTPEGDKVELVVKDIYEYTDMHSELKYVVANNVTTYKTVVPYVGETKASDYLGYTLEAYLVKEGTNWKLLAAVPDDSTASETINAADVNITDYDNTTGIFQYYANDAASRTTKVEIDFANLKVYYNGGLIYDATVTPTALDNTGAVATDVEDLLETKANIITFQGDKNEAYDKIFVTDYDYAQVEEVLADDLYIRTVNGGYDLNPETRPNGADFICNIYDAEGNAMDIADIKEDDILNIVAPLNASNVYDLDDVTYMDIYVTNEVVTGAVEEQVKLNAKYKIDGAVYSLHSNAVGSVSTGDEGTYFLTIDGLVYEADTSASISDNYAFIVNGEDKVSFGEGTHYVQLFTAEGKLETFTVASVLKLTDNTGAQSTLKRTDGTQDAYFGYVDAQGVYHAGPFDALYADKATAAAAKNALKDRVITYKLNSNGELSAMAFAKADDTNAKFNVATNSGSINTGLKYYDDTDVFASQDIDNNSKLFIAPVTLIGATYNVAKDDLAMASYASLDEEASYDAFIYMTSKSDFLGAAIIPEEVTSVIKTAHLAVVKLNTTVLDAAGNDVTKYTFYLGGELLELLVDPEADTNKVSTAETQMTPGDVFRYTVNADGEIDNIQLVYDASAGAMYTAFENSLNLAYSPTTLNTHKTALVYGNISEIKSGKMVVTTTWDDDADGVVDAAIAGATAGVPKLTINNTDGNTYVSVDESLLSNPDLAPNGVKALTSSSSLKASVAGTNKAYFVIATVGENNRFEDCVMIIK